MNAAGLRQKIAALLVAALALVSCAAALEVGRDHPAHPDAPVARRTPLSAVLAVDAGIDDVVSAPDASAAPGHVHHHHGGGSR